MKQLLWLKFYPKDWNGDHNLRACSLAARGLLASLLEPMHEAEPYGHLLVRGKKPEYAELAVIASCHLREVKYGIEELLKNHVLSVNSDGIYYSRRMVRDAERRTRQALGGTRGMATRAQVEHKSSTSSGEVVAKSSTYRGVDQSGPIQLNQPLTEPNLRVVLDTQTQTQVPPIEARGQKLEAREELRAAKPETVVRAVKRSPAENVPGGVKEFLTWFQAEYKTRRNGATYFVKWEVHGKLVKDLLLVYGADRLKKHAVILLKTNEDWTTGTDRGIGILSTKINWLEERLCAWETERKAREAV